MDRSHRPLEDHPGWHLEVGAQVGHFRVVRPLGQGGMAEVYLARDTKLGRRVALKVIQPGALGSEQAVARFLFEARATARFNHPHIVTIHFVGEHQGMPYVALEYLEGQTLRRRAFEEHLGVEEVLRVGLAIADALEVAHADTVVHRDLKPENVMLAGDGRLRVLDFGLAKIVSPDEVVAGLSGVGDPVRRADRLRPASEAVSPLETAEFEDTLDYNGDTLRLPTEPGAFVSHGRGLRGTPAYMSPEQWEEGETTTAVDIWALGVILFELITDRRPYDDLSLAGLAVKVCSPAPAPSLRRHPEVPAPLASLVAHCLDKDPSRRPSAREVVAAIRELRAHGLQLSAGDNPFRGLLPFDEQHSHLFYGREVEVERFAERLRTVPVMPIIGVSGAGKSSFIQAGVIPRLREHGPLRVLHMRPGSAPFATLAAELFRLATPGEHLTSGVFGACDSDLGSLDRDSVGTALARSRLAQRLRESPHHLNLCLHEAANRLGESLLLFVDQLEELCVLVDDPAERDVFMQAVCLSADAPENPVRVVLTLREEFLTRLASSPRAREAFSQITLLRAPSPEALEEILVRPVEAIGYRFEDGSLVTDMIAEVSGELSCLPLLQFAGHRLWERRDQESRTLRRATFEELGGVAGALADHADGVLKGLTATEVDLARTIMLRLVSPAGTRRTPTREVLLGGLAPAADEVLGRLTTARLITVRQSSEGAAELELVHESLVVTWRQLQRWLAESRDDLVFETQLNQAAELWDRCGRRAEEVWQAVGVSYSPDGGHLAVLGTDGGGAVFDVASGDAIIHLARWDAASNTHRTELTLSPVLPTGRPDCGRLVAVSRR